MAAITASACAWVIVPFSTSGARISCSRAVTPGFAGAEPLDPFEPLAGAVVSGVVVGDGLGRGSAAAAGEDQARSHAGGEPRQADGRQSELLLHPSIPFP